MLRFSCDEEADRGTRPRVAFGRPPPSLELRVTDADQAGSAAPHPERRRPPPRDPRLGTARSARAGFEPECPILRHPTNGAGDPGARPAEIMRAYGMIEMPPTADRAPGYLGDMDAPDASQRIHREEA